MNMKKFKKNLVIWSMVLSISLLYVFTATSNVFAANDNIRITITQDSATSQTLQVRLSRLNNVKKYEIYLNDNKFETIYTSRKNISYTFENLKFGDYSVYVIVFYGRNNNSTTSDTLDFSVIDSSATVSPIPSSSVNPEVSDIPTTSSSIEPTVSTTPSQPTATTSEEPEEPIIQNSDANSPEIKSGMIPVKFNTYKNEWVICSKSDVNWFSYSKEARRWANVMLLDSLSTENYTNSQIKELLPTYGSNLCELLEGEKITTMGSMFVWIPRYAYCISSNYHTNNESRFEIEFLDGTSSESSVNKRKFVETPGNGNWLIHPAFTINNNNGGWIEELKGIWVAKFEASGTADNVQFIAGVKSLTNVTIDNSFTASSLISTENTDFYGLTKNSTNSHLLKNSEWGAITYLTYSIYGRDLNEITPNTSRVFTGGGQYESYKANTNQTTTKNIYGIYDLSGGCCEYVSAYCAPLYSDPIYGKTIAEESPYMKNTYTRGLYGAAETYEKNALNYGDAMYETSNHYDSEQSWFNDKSSTFILYSALLRGGTYADGQAAGLFNFEGATGNSFSIYSFRTSIVVQ